MRGARVLSLTLTEWREYNRVYFRVISPRIFIKEGLTLNNFLTKQLCDIECKMFKLRVVCSVLTSFYLFGLCIVIFKMVTEQSDWLGKINKRERERERECNVFSLASFTLRRRQMAHPDGHPKVC